MQKVYYVYKIAVVPKWANCFITFTVIYQTLVSPHPLKSYIQTFQCLHCVISVRSWDYEARWWRKQITWLKLRDFAGCVLKSVVCLQEDLELNRWPRALFTQSREITQPSLGALQRDFLPRLSNGHECSPVYRKDARSLARKISTSLTQLETILECTSVRPAMMLAGHKSLPSWLC